MSPRGGGIKRCVRETTECEGIELNLACRLLITEMKMRGNVCVSCRSLLLKQFPARNTILSRRQNWSGRALKRNNGLTLLERSLLPCPPPRVPASWRTFARTLSWLHLHLRSRLVWPLHRPPMPLARAEGLQISRQHQHQFPSPRLRLSRVKYLLRRSLHGLLPMRRAIISWTLDMDLMSALGLLPSNHRSAPQAVEQSALARLLQDLRHPLRTDLSPREPSLRGKDHKPLLRWVSPLPKWRKRSVSSCNSESTRNLCIELISCLHVPDYMGDNRL